MNLALAALMPISIAVTTGLVLTWVRLDEVSRDVWQLRRYIDKRVTLGELHAARVEARLALEALRDWLDDEITNALKASPALPPRFEWENDDDATARNRP